MIFGSFSIDVAEGYRGQVESSGKNVLMLEGMGLSSKNRGGSQLVSTVADEYM